MSDFQKLDIALKYYLHGARYFTALKAYHYAKKHHSGFRKDLVTPEFQHQIEICLFVTTLKNVPNEEEAITIAILHDVLEDNGYITLEEFIKEFGADMAFKVGLISKEIEGVKTYNAAPEYFGRMANEPIVALVKGCDRIHNLQTMGGVFSKEKQAQYVEETREFFLPMLKTAENQDPELHMAFANIRTMLKYQMKLVMAAIEAII